MIRFPESREERDIIVPIGGKYVATGCACGVPGCSGSAP